MSHGLPRISIIPADAVTDPELRGPDLQVPALFGRHTDRRGWCCRSQVKMARELNCGRGTVQRSIARLVDAGYLEHRSITRESGADAAHQYRVLLDVPDERSASSVGGAHQWAGVPSQDEQGVPSHERAPMLTTPAKRNRESARDEEFDRALKRWPVVDSPKDALAAWNELSPTDRLDAASEIDRFMAVNRSAGRKVICSFTKYLGERMWTALPGGPKPIQPRRAAEAPAGVGPSPFERKNPNWRAPQS